MRRLSQLHRSKSKNKDARESLTELRAARNYSIQAGALLERLKIAESELRND